MNKKYIFIIAIGCVFWSFLAFGESITFTFQNGQITGTTPKYYEFDVYAAAGANGTKLGDCMVYINYNTAAFGSSIVLNGKVTATKGTLVNSIRYNNPVLADNISSRLAVQIEFPSDLEIDANAITTTPTQWAHIKIQIADITKTSGLSFESSMMTDQQYQYDNTTANRYSPVTATSTNDQSLPVQMGDMEAIAMPGEGINLGWRTESEANSAGFHIWRSDSENGTFKRVTTTLISSMGSGSSATEYEFVDKNTLDGKEYWYKIEELSTDGMSEFFGPISVLGVQLPTEYKLSQNYPNPFNPETTIKYELPEVSEVSVMVYTLLGKNVKTLVNKIQNAGRYSVTWNAIGEDGKRVPSGVYFVRIQAGIFSQMRKMMFVQ